jgi:uncharacterized protein (TIGR00255 family)
MSHKRFNRPGRSANVRTAREKIERKNKKLLKSMTGYGRGECQLPELNLTVEIKSVNSRYREVVLRVPKSLQALEDEIRGAVAEKVKRGRVDVIVQMEKNGSEAEYDLELNWPLAKSYKRVADQLCQEFDLKVGLEPIPFLQMKDMIVTKPRDLDQSLFRPALMEALQNALASYEGMRFKEGQVIAEDFLKRLNLIEADLGAIEERSGLVVQEYQKRLKEKVEILTQDLKLDEMRLVQEVALLAERCDITEETVRARSHFEQFRHYLGAQDAVGRRIDFLLQEINREINTISSKSSDITISRKVVEIKGELEKIREQVQNIE